MTFCEVQLAVFDLGQVSDHRGGHLAFDPHKKIRIGQLGKRFNVHQRVISLDRHENITGFSRASESYCSARIESQPPDRGCAVVQRELGEYEAIRRLVDAASELRAG